MKNQTAPKIIQLQHQGVKSFIIGIEKDGQVISALNLDASITSEFEVKPVWTEDITEAWHCSDESIANTMFYLLVEFGNEVH